LTTPRRASIGSDQTARLTVALANAMLASVSAENERRERFPPFDCAQGVPSYVEGRRA
jgi:hypothetical protein